MQTSLVLCIWLRMHNESKRVHMNKIWNYFKQPITTFFMIVLVVACSPATKIQGPPIVPSSLPTLTLAPMSGVSPTVPSPLPTSTFTSTLSITPTFQNTDVPNHYDQNDTFGDGTIALILIKDTNKLNQEDILTKLVNLWLEHYKTKSMAPGATIKDYKDVSVSKVIKDNNNYDGFFAIVALVKFSIIPAEIPNDWASLTIGTTEPNDPWWLVGTVFGYFRDGEYFRLRMMPGWGT